MHMNSNDFRQAIASSRAKASDVYGIAWHNLEEISKIEMIFEFISSQRKNYNQDLLNKIRAKIFTEHCAEDTEDGDVNFCGECSSCLHILAERAISGDGGGGC